MSFDALGKEIARVQDKDLAQQSLRWRAPRARKDRRVVAFIAAAAAFVAVGILGTLLVTRPAALRLADSSLALGAWSDTLDGERPVAFSDGSTVLLRPETRFSILAVTPQGAEFSIERGAAAVSVVHGSNTRWLFHVGPFNVRVVGTRFDIAWNAASETFELELIDGAVTLSGPTLAAERRVIAGEKVTLCISAHCRPPPETHVDGDRGEPQRPAKVKKAADWRMLALDGQFELAVRRATELGLDQIYASASMSDLVLLADTARLANQDQVSRSANEALRKRFPNTQQAQTAGFFLGRIAFDHGDDTEAAAAFERYSKEAPGGPFARESLGRLMETHQRMKNVEAALRIAREYLSEYPSGPHARMARSLVKQ